jgi:phosphohistidine phosphatase SixA
MRLFLALLLSFCSLGTAQADDALWAKLREGGRVALIRHAEAPGGTGDPANFRLDDCATQRNLSERGKAEARELGERMRAHKIAIGKILASQWCRCRETATLMALGAVEDAATFNNAFALGDRRDALTEGARDLIANWQGPGTLVVVTHGANILPLTGIHPAQAEIVVVEPDPSAAGKLKTLGRIAPGA